MKGKATVNIEKKPVNEIKKPMHSDFLEIENAEGMPGLADATIAMDFLLGVKSGIRNMALALTEIADAEARMSVHSLLERQIDLHAALTALMQKKGWLKPYHVSEQFKLDEISAKTAMQLSNLELFPEETNRLGVFATPTV